MRTRRSSAELGSLDSLLDTVTNVVGILIFVVIVAILGLRDAVGRVPGDTGSPQVRVEDLAAAQQDKERALQALAALKSRWGVLQAKLPKDSADLQAIERRLKELEKEVADPTKFRAQLEELLAELKSLEAEVAALGKRRMERQKRLDELLQKKKLFEEEAKRRTVTLPDLNVEAAKEMERVTFYCQNGRICRFQREDLFKKFKSSATEVGALTGDVLDGRKVDALQAHFERVDVGDAFFKLKFLVARNVFSLERLAVRFQPRRGVGESLEELARPDSAYGDWLKRLDAKKQWLYFYVFDGSFEVYLKARSLAERADFLCGWIPYGENEWVESQIYPQGGSGLESGPN